MLNLLGVVDDSMEYFSFCSDILNKNNVLNTLFLEVQGCVEPVALVHKHWAYYVSC